ncbi:MAG: carboxylesterase family protein [Spongiibacteraceae bacterium]|jgi:para-nitrobenzyl esterase|nr:carboxylesterase family protein [Spongiibacteraceae bacterium]
MKKILAILVVICGLSAAQSHAEDTDPAARVQTVEGTLLGMADKHATYAWLGIPYAQPPVGELRWRAPRPAPTWQGERAATAFGSHCMQLANGQTERMPWRWNKPTGSEDCLYLNIWAPRSALTDQRPRPVMLWLHGGGNTIGHAGSYPADTLAGTQDLVVVTINYRLGAFGWFSHPALRADLDDDRWAVLDASGNYGTLDMVEALRWVKRNIAAFGGDPTRDTVIGESAGGRKVASLLVTRPAAGLFHGAIIQSGLTESVSRAEAEGVESDYPGNSASVVQALLASHAHNVSNTPEQLANWLRSLPAGDILKAYPGWTFGMYSLPQLIRDGVVFPEEDFIQVLRDPAGYNVVPVITGTNRDEMKTFLLGDERLVQSRFWLFRSVKDPMRFARESYYRSGKWTASAVTELAQTLSASQGDAVWAYRFDWDEGRKTMFADLSELLGAAHGLDIPFVFGDFESSVIPGVFGDDNAEGTRWLSHRMMSYWAAFARDGRPGQGLQGDLPVWRPWNNPQDKPFIVFDTQADGGVRMSDDTVTIAGLKAQLKADPRYSSNAERCETYQAMFERTRYWRDQEFKAMGCSAKALADN